MTNETMPAEVRSNVWFDSAFEVAASDCLITLAGVDTSDIDLKKHPEAWAALEAFARVVRAAERALCKTTCEAVSDQYQRSEGHRWPELKTDAQDGASACAYAIDLLPNAI